MKNRINKQLREKIEFEITFLNTEGLLIILEIINQLKNRYTTSNIKGKIKINLKEREIDFNERN